MLHDDIQTEIEEINNVHVTQQTANEHVIVSNTPLLHLYITDVAHDIRE